MENTIYPICCGLCGQELHTDEKTTMSNIGREHFEICLLVKERKGNGYRYERILRETNNDPR